MADAEAIQQSQEGPGGLEQRAAAVNRAVHVQGDVANVSKTFIHNEPAHHEVLLSPAGNWQALALGVEGIITSRESLSRVRLSLLRGRGRRGDSERRKSGAG